MITAIVEYNEGAGDVRESLFKFADFGVADAWARSIFSVGYLAIDQQLLSREKRRAIHYLYIPVMQILAIKLTEEIE